MKKLFSGIVAVSLIAGSAGMLSAYAEGGAAPITNAMYATTMEINTGYGGLDKLNALDGNGNERPNTAVDAANGVHFQTSSLVTGEDYVEIDLLKVADVEGVRFRGRGNLQRLENAKITYFDNQDGKWKTAYESIDCSEDGEDHWLYWKTVSLPETVRTAKIRVYPLSWYADYGLIRLDGLQAVGTETTDVIGGNQLYGSNISLSSEGNWLTGAELGGSKTIDGSYAFSTDTVIRLEGLNRRGEIVYNLPEERTMDYVEVTSYYSNQSFKNGTVSAWDQSNQSWEVVGTFQNPYQKSTFGRMHTDLSKTVTTDKLKISFDDGAPGDDVTFSEVYAGVTDWMKLSSLYFTSYNLLNPNPDALCTDLNHLHEDGVHDKNPGDETYGNVYDSVFFVNPQGENQPAGNEDYIEMLLSAPSDVKSIVVKTVNLNKEDEQVYSKPTSMSVYYLDHVTGKWTYDGCLSIPTTEYVSNYYFAKAVYADAIRVYVTGIEEPANYFRLAGLYAVGQVRDGKMLNNGNVIGTGFIDLNGHKLKNIYDGKIARENFNPGAGNYTLSVNFDGFKDFNQVEIIWNNTLNIPESVSVNVWGSIKDSGANNDWSNGVAESAVEIRDTGFNAARQIITLPNTYTAYYASLTLKNTPGASLAISEIIFRNAEKTGYTISDTEVTQNGNLYTLKTEAENNESASKFYDVFYAAYQNGKLVGVLKNTLDLKPFSKRTRSATFDFSDLTGEVQLKRYIWTEDQTPYTAETDVQTITLSEN